MLMFVNIFVISYKREFASLHLGTTFSQEVWFPGPFELPLG